ncbi:MAG: hypothetical protein C0518_08325 [Opitutus sp.]|nr:hypothetical protein [Opitutus sp.]
MELTGRRSRSRVRKASKQPALAPPRGIGLFFAGRARHSASMLRWSAPLLCLVVLLGCAKPDLPATTVRAGSTEELAAFRADLGQDFSPAQLASIDTALQELQLAGMDRGLASAAARAAAMRETVHGKTVRAVEILGWQARRTRLLSEITQMSATLDADLKTRERLGAATALTVTNRIQNVQDILVKLRRLLAETEQQLGAWDAPPAV